MDFITVSEMVGANGEEIAREVANQMGYPFYGMEELLKVADEMGFLSDVQQVEIKGPSLLERLLSDRPRIFLDRIQAVIYEVARRGDAVFFGKGSQLLLRAFECAFRVLIIASWETRIKRVMEKNPVTRDVAENILHTSDRDKRGFLRFAFDEDWLNPNLYDVVINTDKVNIKSAAAMIVHPAKSDEIKECGIEAVKSLGMLSLQRKIESALMEAGLMNPFLSFSVEGVDSVRISGSVNSSVEASQIIQTLKEIEGVKNVKNDLTVLTMR
jgi:cytidylate kinase